MAKFQPNFIRTSNTFIYSFILFSEPLMSNICIHKLVNTSVKAGGKIILISEILPTELYHFWICLCFASCRLHSKLISDTSWQTVLMCCVGQKALFLFLQIQDVFRSHYKRKHDIFIFVHILLLYLLIRKYYLQHCIWINH